MSDWTPKQLGDAYRAAVAIALAGHREDGEAVAVLWNESQRKDALVYALSRLPAVLIEAVSLREGVTLDPEEVLAGLVDRFPVIVDPQEN